MLAAAAPGEVAEASRRRWRVLVGVGLVAVVSGVVGYAASVGPPGVGPRGAGAEPPPRLGLESRARNRARQLAVERGVFTDEALADQITYLPGQLDEDVPFLQFSGYFDLVNRVPATGREPQEANVHVFYWFTESQRSPKDDPLLLYLVGGPGCASALALFTEVGPWKVMPGAVSVELSKTAVNQAANVLFVDVPIGAGFSYGTGPEANSEPRYKPKPDMNDGAYVMLLYRALEGFFERYPHYQSHKFFVAGESYAGHFLAEIVTHLLSRGSHETSKVPMPSGVLGFNPLIDHSLASWGFIEEMWYQQIIPLPMYEKWAEQCHYTATLSEDDDADSNPTCRNIGTFYRDFIAPLDPFMINYPVCYEYSYNRGKGGRHDGKPRSPSAYALMRASTWNLLYDDDYFNATSLSQAQEGGQRRLTRKEFDDDQEPTDDFEGHAYYDGPNLEYDACEEDWSTDYLDRADVREALGVGIVPTRAFSMCNTEVTLAWDRAQIHSSKVSTYATLANNYPELELWIVSGTEDAIVSGASVQRLLGLIGAVVKQKWRPWSHNGQVGGHFQTFGDKGNLKHVTVRGVGHFVLWGQPGRGLHVLTRFLKRLQPSAMYY